VNAGETLAFRLKFLTNEFAGDPTDDFAFYTIDAGAGATLFKLWDINDPGLTLTSAPLDVAYGFETPWSPVTHFFLSAGTYTLGFGVVDVEGIDVSSAILIDAVVIRPARGGPNGVPEPGALAAVPAAGIAGFWVLRRRRR
jgi:hypothetical protein